MSGMRRVGIMTIVGGANRVVGRHCAGGRAACDQRDDPCRGRSRRFRGTASANDLPANGTADVVSEFDETFAGLVLSSGGEVQPITRTATSTILATGQQVRVHFVAQLVSTRTACQGSTSSGSRDAAEQGETPRISIPRRCRRLWRKRPPALRPVTRSSRTRALRLQRGGEGTLRLLRGTEAACPDRRRPVAREGTGRRPPPWRPNRPRRAGDTGGSVADRAAGGLSGHGSRAIHLTQVGASRNGSTGGLRPPGPLLGAGLVLDAEGRSKGARLTRAEARRGLPARARGEFRAANRRRAGAAPSRRRR